MSGLKIITQPAVEPVTLAEAKLWAKIEASSTTHDDLINSLITSARMKAELYTWRAFISQELRWSADTWPEDGEISLLRPPLIDDTDLVVEWKDDDGEWNEVDPDDYWVDSDSEPGRLWPVSSWPSHAAAPGAVRVTYWAGYGETAADVPELIKTAIKRAVATWFEYRQDIVSGTISPELPQTALIDLQPYRLMEFR